MKEWERFMDSLEEFWLNEEADKFVLAVKGVFGWAFGFDFWPQKLKVQPKRLFLKGAFSEAAAFP